MNAYSRYLDGYGHVSDIVNNYEYISFNFGPTLAELDGVTHHGQARISGSLRLMQNEQRPSRTRQRHSAGIQPYDPASGIQEEILRMQIAWGSP